VEQEVSPIRRLLGLHVGRDLPDVFLEGIFLPHKGWKIIPGGFSALEISNEIQAEKKKTMTATAAAAEGELTDGPSARRKPLHVAADKTMAMGKGGLFFLRREEETSDWSCFLGRRPLRNGRRRDGAFPMPRGDDGVGGAHGQSLGSNSPPSADERTSVYVRRTSNFGLSVVCVRSVGTAAADAASQSVFCVPAWLEVECLRTAEITPRGSCPPATPWPRWPGVHGTRRKHHVFVAYTLACNSQAVSFPSLSVQSMAIEVDGRTDGRAGEHESFCWLAHGKGFILADEEEKIGRQVK